MNINEPAARLRYKFLAVGKHRSVEFTAGRFPSFCALCKNRCVLKLSLVRRLR